jgi:hypothetical protein
MESTPETSGKMMDSEPLGENAKQVLCPWCDSADVEKVSEYGPHLMVYSFICRSCHSPFEVIKR